MVHVAGVGYHIAAVEMENPAKVIRWAKSIYAVDCLYLTSFALPKISILALYLRGFTRNGARLACHISMRIVVTN